MRSRQPPRPVPLGPRVRVTRAAAIALVGERSAHVRAHTRIPILLEALRHQDGLALDAYWVSTDEAETTRLDAFDGVWLLPGSPYRSEAGAVHAVRVAREQAIAFLGTCGGFQHALLEFARNVCGHPDVAHAENTPDADPAMIIALACSLAGHEGAVRLTAGSLVERILGVERAVERYHCSYGLHPDYVDVLADHGMRFTGHDDTGAVRIAELPDHPFFLATLFQPELATVEGARAHPIIRAFAEAAVAHAADPHTPRTVEMPIR
jgi:CTP synthase (UTP-ammonia lyase)